MKLLFLDIDEVLTSTDFRVRYFSANGRTASTDDLDPLACARLERVLVETGATIVLTSRSWAMKGISFTQQALRSFGAPSAHVRFEISQRHRNRGEGISEWLAWFGYVVTEYAVVDDGLDAGIGHESRFVRTTQEHGLTDDDAERLIRILKGNT